MQCHLEKNINYYLLLLANNYCVFVRSIECIYTPVSIDKQRVLGLEV